MSGNTFLKFALLTTTIGVTMAWAENSEAFVQTMRLRANAPSHCQAFTPGVTNTIRNRVLSAENVGASAIAVACAFPTNEPLGGFIELSSLTMWAWNGSVAAVDITCTAATGAFGGLNGAPTTFMSQTFTANPGVDASVAWSSGFPVEWDVAKTQPWIGVNCVVPSQVHLTRTFLRYTVENGAAPAV